MLHILWMLIKFILILLGILLGLLFCLVLLLLFCPFRYRAEAAKEGVPILQADADIRASWLFGGISLRYRRHCGNGKKELRIFGISIEKLLFKKKKKTGGTEQMPKPEAFVQTSPQKENPVLMDKEIADTEEAASSEPEQKKDSSPFQNEDRETPSFRKKNKFSAILGKLKEIQQKIRDIPGIIHRISLTIHGICDKMDWWKNFISHPRTRAGIDFAWTRVKKLLFHVFPKKIHGQIIFDSEDPSVTGAVLAVLGMTMPLHQNRIEVTPLFENSNILEGTVSIKGRIYGFIPVKILLELYFNKDIKYILRRWKHKEV